MNITTCLPLVCDISQTAVGVVSCHWICIALNSVVLFGYSDSDDQRLSVRKDVSAKRLA